MDPKQLQFVLNWMERVATDKHPSLLGPYVSYEENKVLFIQSHVQYSQHLILLLTYEWAQ